MSSKPQAVLWNSYQAGDSGCPLTDVIKRRGRGTESRNKLPTDLKVHVEILRREIEIVQPSRIVALGACAEKLLVEYVPEVREKVRRGWHFAYGARPGRSEGFEAQLRAAIE